MHFLVSLGKQKSFTAFIKKKFSGSLNYVSPRLRTKLQEVWFFIMGLIMDSTILT